MSQLDQHEIHPFQVFSTEEDGNQHLHHERMKRNDDIIGQPKNLKRHQQDHARDRDEKTEAEADYFSDMSSMEDEDLSMEDEDLSMEEDNNEENDERIEEDERVEISEEKEHRRTLRADTKGTHAPQQQQPTPLVKKTHQSTKSSNNNNNNHNQHHEWTYSPMQTSFPTPTPDAMVQCVIKRVKSGFGNSFQPTTYDMVLQDGNVPLLFAKKQFTTRTSNYHIYDTSRGVLGNPHKWTKKCGNYLGKLRANKSRHANVIVSNHQTERHEYGAIQFCELVDDHLPRKFYCILPTVGTEPRVIPRGRQSGLLDAFCDQQDEQQKTQSPDEKMIILESADPTFLNDCYRLNFRGRVREPSVKNFQLVHSSRGISELEDNVGNLREVDYDAHEIQLQFGKVSDETFHLDFRPPITAFQAFAMVLAQFNH